ncbi:hypothetical protein ACVME8_006598 [Bradyrhizobium diazoefficiens]
MEAATTENYEVRPNDQGRSSSIRAPWVGQNPPGMVT